MRKDTEQRRLPRPFFAFNRLLLAASLVIFPGSLLARLITYLATPGVLEEARYSSPLWIDVCNIVSSILLPITFLIELSRDSGAVRKFSRWVRDG